MDHQNVDNLQARTSGEGNDCLISLLPDHLICHILAKLPVYTILNVKYVCKRFLTILRDPYFAQLHLTNARDSDNCLVIQGLASPSNILFAPIRDLQKATIYSKDKNRYDDKSCSWQILTRAYSLPKIKYWSPVLVGSCNGLLFWKYVLNSRVFFCVCNPILGEFMILPQPMSVLSSVFSGFGFCPKTRQYKVLQFLSDHKCSEILTIGTDKWRRLSDATPRPTRPLLYHSSFKGNLHWLIYCDSGKDYLICSFNLETEGHSYISLPSCCRSKTDILIGTLDGLFCVSHITSPGHFEAYVMEDYEVEESWTKKICIDMGFQFEFQGFTQKIGFLNNGALLLRSHDQLFYYDFRNGGTAIFKTTNYYCRALPHIPSFISLKDIVRRENVEEVEQKWVNVFSSKMLDHKLLDKRNKVFPLDY